MLPGIVMESYVWRYIAWIRQIDHTDSMVSGCWFANFGGFLWLVSKPENSGRDTGFPPTLGDKWRGKLNSH